MSGLHNGTTYYLTVEAINVIGNSAASNEASATPATVPGAPAHFRTLAVKKGKITLTWRAPVSNGGRGVTGYEIYFAKRSNMSGVKVADPKPLSSTARSYTVKGLKKGTRYYFELKAINPIGRGPAAKASAVPE